MKFISKLKYLFKIFVQNSAHDLVDSCITEILEELEINYIDYLIVSFAESESDETIDDIWKQINAEKTIGRAHKIGVADFCKHKLERLIKSTSLKPDIDQLSPTASNGYCGLSPGKGL